MLTRIVFGAAGILYLIAMFIVGDWFFNLSVLLFALIGTAELYSAFRKKGYRPISWLGYLFIPLFYYFYMKTTGYSLLSVVFCMLTALSLAIFKPKIKPLDVSLTVFGFFYPGVFFLFVILLKDYVSPYNHNLLILTCFATFGTDTFAYFAGFCIGKNKLCPRISPKKTIEGSIGGLLGGILVSVLVGLLLNRLYNVPLSWRESAAIGVLSGLFSQLGDLTASVIKRFCEIKDFGRLLPGHGGILDRFDSLLFTAPVIYCFYLLFLAP
jgi:phosphatidate cytidylyltransferase